MTVARLGGVVHDQAVLIAALERRGAVHQACDFCIEAVHSIRDIVVYDEAHVCFLGFDAAVYDEYLVDVSKATVQDYHRHYAHVDGDAYSASRFAREYTARMRGNERNRYIPVVVNWALEPHDTTFSQEHLAPQNPCRCIGFGFFALAISPHQSPLHQPKQNRALSPVHLDTGGFSDNNYLIETEVMDDAAIDGFIRPYPSSLRKNLLLCGGHTRELQSAAFFYDSNTGLADKYYLEIENTWYA